MKCSVCGKGAEVYEDEYVKQWYCDKCGWWMNV